MIVGAISKGAHGAYGVATITRCPYCKTKIRRDAKVCVACNRDLSATEIVRRPITRTLTDSPKQQIVSDKRELEEYLELLDKRFVEGGVSEETYKELKAEYKGKLRRVEKDSIKESLKQEIDHSYTQLGPYCPHCSKWLGAHAYFVGQTNTCPHCGQIFTVTQEMMEGPQLPLEARTRGPYCPSCLVWLGFGFIQHIGQSKRCPSCRQFFRITKEMMEEPV